MSKFIEVTAGTKVLINTEEIACVEPSKDYLDGSEVCVITLIHTTKHGKFSIEVQKSEGVSGLIIYT